jgi:O-antigen/teichoic acid export membrane protein
MPSTSAAIARNTLYQAVGKVVGTGFGVLAFGLTSRYLGPEEFGAYATATTWVGLVATLADLGLPVLHLRIRSLKNPVTAKELPHLHTMRLITSIGLIGIGGLVGSLLPFSPETHQGMWVVSLGYVAVSLSQYIVVVMQERLATLRAAISEVIGRVVMFAVVLLTVQANLGLGGMYAAVTAGSIAGFVMTYFLARALAPFPLSFDLSRWPGLLRMAAPLILLTIFQIVYFKVDTLLLSWIQGDGAVGLYSAAYKYIDVIVTFPVLFSSLVLPFVARAAEANQRALLARRFARALTAVIAGAVPLAVVLALESDRLVVLLSGPEFVTSGALLRILALAVVPLFIGNLATMTLIGYGRASTVAWLFGIAATLGVGTYALTISSFGATGAAWSTVGIEAVIGITALIAVLRKTREASLLRMVSIVISGAACAGVLYLARTQPLAISLAAGLVVYIAALIITRGVTLEEAFEVVGFARRRVTPQTRRA